MNSKIKIAIASVCGLALVACAVLGIFDLRGTSSNPQIWSDLKDSAIVLKVGDESYTKQSIDQLVEGNLAMIRLNNVIKPENEIKVRTMLMNRAAYELPIRKYFEAEFPADAKLDEALIAQRYQMYAKRFGGKRSDVEAFKAQLAASGAASVIESQMISELKFEYVLQHVHSNDVTVTDAEFAKTVKDMNDYIAKINATNALLYADATNAWKRLKNGEDFVKVVDECSQDPDKAPGGVLDEMGLNDFNNESEAWRAAVLRLKEGEFTDVLESSTGLEIVKLLEIVPAIRSDSGEDSYRLARVFIRRAYMPTREPDEQIWRELAEEKRTKFLARTTDEAIAAGKIVYPFGRKVFRLVLPKEAPATKISNNTEE